MCRWSCCCLVMCWKNLAHLSFSAVAAHSLAMEAALHSVMRFVSPRLTLLFPHSPLLLLLISLPLMIH